MIVERGAYFSKKESAQPTPTWGGGVFFVCVGVMPYFGIRASLFLVLVKRLILHLLVNRPCAGFPIRVYT